MENVRLMWDKVRFEWEEVCSAWIKAICGCGKRTLRCRTTVSRDEFFSGALPEAWIRGEIQYELSRKVEDELLKLCSICGKEFVLVDEPITDADIFKAQIENA